MIEFKNISLSFSGKIIAEDLNISIANGEHICFSAPSGKGKSTLLKLILGMQQPDKGIIQIKNLILNTSTIMKLRASITWIPQNTHLPVNNGLELLKLMNITSSTPSVNDYLRFLGLEQDILTQDMSKISGGQKQRIIIAICLSLDKEIILIDEPTSSLDDRSIDLLIDTINSLKEKTIVSASHNPAWMGNTDRVITL